jgi:hypothetical protein
MLEARILRVFKSHGEVGAEGDCFGFHRNMKLIECRGCLVNKKCGEIRADIRRLPIVRRSRKT